MPDDTSSVDDPTAKDDRALRWGRYVVEYFHPQPGGVIVIHGPDNDDAAQKRIEMADAIEANLPEDEKNQVTFILGPSHSANLSFLDEKQMNEIGWHRHPYQDDDADPHK